MSVASLAGFAAADVVWDEAVDGELSDNYLAPTQLDFAEGLNTVIFTTDREGDDRDIFTFDVGDGLELTGIILDLFDTNGSEHEDVGPFESALHHHEVNSKHDDKEQQRSHCAEIQHVDNFCQDQSDHKGNE